MRERTVTISSAAKTFSFTGWKIGWVTGDPGTGDRGAHGQAVPHLRHRRAVPVRGGPGAGAARRLLRRDQRGPAGQARPALRRAWPRSGFEVYRPAGTYFVTTDIRPLGETDGMEFCRELPGRAGVVAIPSSVFYDNEEAGRSQVRFAFCKKDEVLREAIARLAAASMASDVVEQPRRTTCSARACTRRWAAPATWSSRPASIATALRMTLLGARGETAGPTRRGAAPGQAQDAAAGLRAGCPRCWTAWPPATSRCARRTPMWVQSGLPLQPDFTAALAQAACAPAPRGRLPARGRAGPAADQRPDRGADRGEDQRPDPARRARRGTPGLVLASARVPEGGLGASVPGRRDQDAPVPPGAGPRAARCPPCGSGPGCATCAATGTRRSSCPIRASGSAW